MTKAVWWSAEGFLVSLRRLPLGMGRLYADQAEQARAYMEEMLSLD